jgi:hypothetical protein
MISISWRKIFADHQSMRRITAEGSEGTWQAGRRILPFCRSAEVAMPELVRLYVQSAVLGFLIAAVFTAGLVWFDVAGLGHLILGSDIGWIAAVMLVVFNGIVFSAVQFAFRVMGLAERDDPPAGGHGSHELQPVPVRVRARS